MPAARVAFRYLLTLFLAGVAVQFFLAGLGAFRTQHGTDHGTVGDSQFSHFFHPHVVLGSVLQLVALLLLVTALAGRMGRRWVLPALALAVLTILQSVFANSGPPWFRALHVLSAFAIAGIAGSQTGLVWRDRAPA